LAVRAACAIGEGLYSVDIKERGGKLFVIEVNDNPSLENGEEEHYPDVYERIVARLMKA
jgi:glutathione synthase/RimK-type ligase-like ATP-grasp enzyme